MMAWEYALAVPALAQAGSRPPRIRSGMGHEPSLVSIRRFHITDGTVGWNPGRQNLRIARYTPAKLTWADSVGEKAPFLDQVKARRVLDLAARAGKPLDAECR